MEPEPTWGNTQLPSRRRVPQRGRGGIDQTSGDGADPHVFEVRRSRLASARIVTASTWMISSRGSTVFGSGTSDQLRSPGPQ